MGPNVLDRRHLCWKLGSDLAWENDPHTLVCLKVALLPRVRHVVRPIVPLVPWQDSTRIPATAETAIYNAMLIMGAVRGSSH